MVITSVTFDLYLFAKYTRICAYIVRDERASLLKALEMPGIEPGAFHMQSERSTTELHPPTVNATNTEQHHGCLIKTCAPHWQICYKEICISTSVPEAADGAPPDN